MRIKSITAENMLCHDRLSITMERPVNVFLGRNGSGKSAIKDIVEFGISGTARGIRYIKDATVLSGAHGKHGKVSIVTGSGEIRATTSGSRNSKLEDKEKDIVSVLCDPMRIASMPSKQRQRLFALLGEQANKTIAEMLRSLDVTDCPAEIAELKDIDKAEAIAVDNRRGAKRVMAHIKQSAHEKPPLSIDVGGTLIQDLDEFSPSDVSKAGARLDDLARLRTRLELSIENAGEQKPRDIDRIQADYKETEEILQGFVEDIEKAEIATERNADAVRVVRENLARLEGEATSRADLASRVKNLGKLCVLSTKELEITCPMDMETAQKTIKGLAPDDKLRDRIQEEGDRLNKLQKKVDQASRARDQSLAAAKEEKQRYFALSDELTAATNSPAWVDVDAVRREIEGVDERIRNGQKIHDAVGKATAWRADQKRIVESLKIERDNSERWNKIATLLAEGGPVRGLLAETPAGVVPDAGLSQAWDMAVSTLSTGDVVCNERMIEFCSYSEQWRASMLVADMLARATGSGWIILDQIDSLDQATRKALNGWFARYEQNGYKTIIALGAAAEPPSATGLPQWLGLWWITHSEARRINTSKPEASQ